MTSYKYRSAVRFVAYFEAITSGVSVAIALSVAAFGVGVLIIEISNSRYVDSDQRANSLMALWSIVTFTVIAAYVAASQLWAAVKFLRAMKQGMGISESSKNLRIWRNFSVAFLLMIIMWALMLGNFLLLTVLATIRGTMLYYVCRFITELNEL